MRKTSALFISILISSCVAGDPEGNTRAESLVDGFYDATVVFNDEEIDVTLELKNNRFLFGGDMEIPVQSIKTIDVSSQGLNTAPSLNFNYIVNQNQLWPNGILPYELSDDLTSQGRNAFLDAIKIWEEQTTIRFVVKTSAHNDYVQVVDGEGCSAILGRRGGPQNITLSERADLTCGIHEIGHALGLRHEHQRSDRNDHIDIFRDNLKWDDDKFNTNFGQGGQSFGSYDTNSIMHYNSFFSDTDAIDPAKPVLLGKSGTEFPRRRELSLGDLRGVDFLYGELPDYSPPSNVRVDGIEGNEAVCRWTPSRLVETGFNFKYSVSLSKIIQESPFQVSELHSIVEAGKSDQSYKFSNLDTNSRYKCVVKVKNDRRIGDESPPAIFQTKLISTPLIRNSILLSDTSIDLHWGRVSSPHGGITYTVTRDGNHVTTTTGTQIRQEGLTSRASYSYEVVAKDSRGNESAVASRDVFVGTIPKPSFGGIDLGGLLGDLLEQSVSNDSECEPSGPVDANGNDEDGWGWDGSESCRLNQPSQGNTDSSSGTSGYSASNDSCRPAGPVDSNGNDADGWGWDGTASCVL